MISKLLSFVLVVLTVSVAAMAADTPKSETLPLSTNSPKVRRMMEKVWELDLDQVEQAEAVVVLRKIVKIDPNFAVAHELLAQCSLDPAEQVREQKKAWATRRYATKPEQTLVEWFQNSADHKLIPAITDMNEVVNQYPHDKWVVFLANFWLTTETQYERAAQVYERSGIADSPGLMNNVAYTYAFMRQYDKALVLMDKYVAALPKISNPQDSYAEILRMAGRFDESVDHYRAALSINPRFYSSEFGIADTYSLMGDEVQARQAYEAAFRKYPSIPMLHKVQWKTREATTYIFEGDLKGADKAFQSLADYAHANKMGQVEADTYRQMAMYQANSKRSLMLLDKAEAAIHEGQNAMTMNIQQELSQILRARAEAELKMGDRTAADATLKKIEGISENSDDKIIDSAYHGAAGAVLSSQHKYREAISHLEEDINNPLSLKLLAAAYHKTGDTENAKHVSETLANVNDPTLEQAMVVPAFRKCMTNPNCEAGFKNAALKP